MAVKEKGIVDEKITISLHILESKIRLLNDLAFDLEMSRNQIINLCIDFAIKNDEFLDMLGYSLPNKDQ